MVRIALVSSEGDAIDISLAAIRTNNIFAVMLPEADNAPDDDCICEVPYTTAIVKKIVEFCEHYIQEPMRKIKRPLVTYNPLDVQAWYLDFVKLPDADLFALLKFANYLENLALCDLISATIAEYICTHDNDAIRARFRILQDLSPEEVLEIETGHKLNS